MYLQITNKGTVSRKYFELIGATNKRERWNDSSVIGNKGSGAKLAVVPALRLGLNIAVSSSDALGDYVLRYHTQEADLGDRTAKQIVFSYDGDGSFPSQLTLEAFRDWDKPIGDDDKKVFKALREYICNAYDEDKSFSINEVEDVSQAKPGTTVVFISLTDEIRSILQSLPRYFKILSREDPLFTRRGSMFSPGGAIYEKSQPGTTRLFSQGVLVDCKKESWYASAFDYSLDDKSLLSEERVIKDFNHYTEGVGQLLLSLKEPTLIIKLFQAAAKREAKIELQAIESTKQVPATTAELWKLAWMLHFSPKAVIAANITQVDEDARNKGFVVVSNLPYELTQFLKRCGVSNAADVVPKVETKKDAPPEYELVELDAEQQSRYNQAYTIFLAYYPEAHKLSVHFFRPLGWRWKDAGGHCGVEEKQYKEIWIAERMLDSVENILTILVHEGRHCLQKAGDYDRKFTQAADEQLVKLMLTHPSPVESKNNWRASIVSRRGIMIPARFIGNEIHVLVHGQELRLKVGTGNQVCNLSAQLPSRIEGQVSQTRKVTKFKTLGCVNLPDCIIKQLPAQLSLEIR